MSKQEKEPNSEMSSEERGRERRNTINELVNELSGLSDFKNDHFRLDVAVDAYRRKVLDGEQTDEDFLENGASKKWHSIVKKFAQLEQEALDEQLGKIK